MKKISIIMYTHLRCSWTLSSPFEGSETTGWCSKNNSKCIKVWRRSLWVAVHSSILLLRCPSTWEGKRYFYVGKKRNKKTSNSVIGGFSYETIVRRWRERSENDRVQRLTSECRLASGTTEYLCTVILLMKNSAQTRAKQQQQYYKIN